MKTTILLFSVLVFTISGVAQFQQQTPSASIESAARDAAKRQTAEKLAGESEQRIYGADILTPTNGVDLGPYLQTMLPNIRRNWFRFVPDSARAPERRSPWRKPKLKQGIVSIEFVIHRDGSLGDLRVTESSEDEEFDKAALLGISESAPFPHLPEKLKSETLRLRCRFYYNPSHAARRAK